MAACGARAAFENANPEVGCNIQGTAGSPERLPCVDRDKLRANFVIVTRGKSHLARQPALKSCEAPDRAPPGARPPRETRALGGRDFTARDHRQNLRHCISS
jgi:hypothetical protein